jgi:hypothetical protein
MRRNIVLTSNIGSATDFTWHDDKLQQGHKRSPAVQKARSANIVDIILQQYYQGGICAVLRSIIPLFLTVGYVLDRTTIFPQFLHYSSSQSACRF